MLDRRTLLAAAAGPALAVPAGATVPTIVRTQWHDPARDRDIPVLIRLPSRPGPAPLVVVSHGLGGSRDGLAYLGAGLAAAGFAAVHLQHHGSDAALWEGAADPRAAMMGAASNVSAALDRLRDVSFSLDLVLGGREPSLAGRVDAGRLAVAGHSFGAWTVAHMLGERLPLGGWGLGLPDTRLRAGIELSPIPPIGVSPGSAFDAVTVPVLYVTGTEDRGWGVSAWQDRAVGFRNTAGPAGLAVLDGARHASFAGEAGAGAYWNEPRFQDRTARLCTLFLQSVLDGDEGARRTLRSGGGLVPPDRLELRGL